MAFTKFELLTSSSFEKIRILFLRTQRYSRKFPASTAVPVLAFPSSYLKVPSYKSVSDAEIRNGKEAMEGYTSRFPRTLSALFIDLIIAKHNLDFLSFLSKQIYLTNRKDPVQKKCTENHIS